MSRFRRAAAVCTLALAFAPALPAAAQDGLPCPSLPAGSGLAWERLEGPDFTFCKAVATGGGEPVFSVMLGRESGFKPRRGDRVEEARVDGHAVHWYRGELSGASRVEVRETVVEIAPDRVAHISLRAADAESAANAMRQAEALSFDDPRLSRN